MTRRRKQRVRPGAGFSSGAIFVLAGLLLSGCPGSNSSTSEESIDKGFPNRSNILLVTIDTLRADHLSAYGYERETSPFLDGLAAEGVLFERAAVQWPKTGPSFASMFTSTYPKDNGIVRKVGIEVPLDFDLMAERLHDAGYATHAIVANGALAKEFNFDQGFDSYMELWKMEDDGDIGATQGGYVTDRALEIAAGIDPEKPFFLWVHYIDPHFPYEPPPAWRDRFQDDEFFDGERQIEIDYDRPKREMVGIGSDQALEERTDLAFYVARYDAEIAYADQEVGRLIGSLGELGLMEKTLTAITSDHGESLGEHYYFFDHGRFGFQTCVNVPFILHFPGALPPRVDPDPVELIHLAPTILDAAGLLPEEGFGRGTSLFGRIVQNEEPQTPADPDAGIVFSEAGYGRLGMWQRIAQDGRYKFVDAQEGEAQRWVTGRVGSRYALFDLEADPGETENLFTPENPDARRLARAMERWLRTGDGTPRAAEQETDMDEATRKQLEALGYLGGASTE